MAKYKKVMTIGGAITVKKLPSKWERFRKLFKK